MTESYSLMRSEPDVNTCRSRATFYYVDGVRVSQDRYDFLNFIATRKDCLYTKQSARGRWLFDCCIFA